MTADGRYWLVLPGPDDIYRSVVIEGLWLRVAWLWPRVLTVLKELGVL